MRTRRDALFLLAGSGFADLAFRITQVALPLVVLQETGSVAATGLAGGAAGIPMLLSPWWARRARQWVDSGRQLAVVAGIQAVALAMVPAAAELGVLTAWVLIVSGLLLGCGDALAFSGRSALLADTGDRWDAEAQARRVLSTEAGSGRAVVLLTWQEGVRRVGTVVGPPVGALAVAGGFVGGLLWIEAAVVLVAGVLAVGVVGERSQARGTAMPTIRASLVGRRDVLYGWVARGTGCLTWFAFSLGLSVIGAQRARPGVYLAAGMSGFGVGSVGGTLVSLAVIRRVQPVRLAGGSWAVVGLCMVGMGLWTTPAGVAVLGTVAGATVVFGIVAISMLITRTSSGAERRALLSAQSVVENASTSAGLLIGAPVIAVAGAQHTLIGSGILTATVALGVVMHRRRAARNGGHHDTAEHVGGDRDHHAGQAA